MGKENGCNLHINGKAILRDGELFYTKLGIGLFEEGIYSRYAGQVPVKQEWRVVWLPSETRDLAAQVESGEATLVEGQLGAGKSALLYGLRAHYRNSNQPYAHIDGHFSKTAAQIIEKKMDWAVKHNGSLTWDSLDYLIGGSRKIRKLSVGEQRIRSTLLMNLLSEYIDSGHPFVGTSHTKPWLEKYGDPELLEGPWQELMTRMKVHNVRGEFDRPEEIIQFYRYANFTSEHAQYLASLPDNQKLAALLKPPSYSPEVSSEIVKSLREYRIAKLLALDPGESSQKVRQLLVKSGDGEIEEAAFLENLVEFILEINQETRIRMGQKGAA